MVPYLGYGGNEEEREVNHWFYCVKYERRDEEVVGEEATPVSISRRGPGREDGGAREAPRVQRMVTMHVCALGGTETAVVATLLGMENCSSSYDTMTALLSSSFILMNHIII